MNRALTLFGLLACLALVAVGCGSGDDDGSSDSTATATATKDGGSEAVNGDDPQPAANREHGGATGDADDGDSADGSGDGGSSGADDGSAGGGDSTKNGGASGLGGNDGRGSKARGGRSGSGASNANPGAGFEIRPGADNSIQEYGSEATGDDKSAAVAAMLSFFRAMANSDYPGVCAGLTKANVEQLEMFLKLKEKQGNCATVLGEILGTQAPEARRALAGTIYQVREEDGNAFVLFTPQGGQASYFVMKSEDGAWKSTSVTAGTPLVPGS